MATSIAQHGTATISSTSAGPGTPQSVTLTSTGNFTTTHYVSLTKINKVDTVLGPVGLYYSRTSDDVIVVYADKQLPAGTSLGFNWVSTTGTP